MIYHIIQSYLVIFLSIGMASLFILLGGLYLILKPRRQLSPKEPSPAKTVAIIQETQPNQEEERRTSSNAKQAKSSLTITSSDIAAIAGEDVLSTQLDLAQAYLEAGRKQLAKKILEYVAEQGNDTQQTEARKLLGTI
ncbi:FimV/HubP family polar landmark protein [Aquicella lusitana]|uniref:FimV-like protein n=1 Tax=Aquicella lusitana TaxID=254246 RepID=A0A370GRC9_9COXI|nr:FimV/HubP family polar landmark protein [Aquicella lusitana]RDI46071.1 FimV-like protein [Aquicella lusitana]VVC73332.1 hypothetical protein AQULUS_10670 [Aquicella lusitana]